MFTPDGQFLRAIGKEGGRPWVGAWDPHGMLVPARHRRDRRREAVGRRGRRLAEAGQRVGRRQRGLRKRLSSAPPLTAAAPISGSIRTIPPGSMPKAPASRSICSAGTWTPEAISYRRAEPRRSVHAQRPQPGRPTKQVRILYRGGREYAVFNLDRGIVSILRRQGDVYRPVAALRHACIATRKPDATARATRRSVRDDFGYHVYRGFFPACFRGHLGDNYSWSDANGDGLVQPEEMHWVKTIDTAYRPGAQGRCASYWGNDISPDWSYFFAARFRDRLAVFRLDVKGWTAAGAPIYDMADARPILLPRPGAPRSTGCTSRPTGG